MTHYRSLPEIRALLGLTDFDAYWLEQQRLAYELSSHRPLMLTTHKGPRPFTVEVALAYGERCARTDLR